MAIKKELNYQQAYDELSNIVSEIENDEIPLDLKCILSMT